MSLRELLRRIVTTAEPYAGLESRRQRRERARARHAQGGPGWSDADRHLNPNGPREVADVAPGTPGHGASRRWLGRR